MEEVTAESVLEAVLSKKSIVVVVHGADEAKAASKRLEQLAPLIPLSLPDQRKVRP